MGERSLTCFAYACFMPRNDGVFFLTVGLPRTLRKNPKNNDKKMKWLVEPVGILVLYDALFEEERERHLMRFSSIRL